MLIYVDHHDQHSTPSLFGTENSNQVPLQISHFPQMKKTSRRFATNGQQSLQARSTWGWRQILRDLVLKTIVALAERVCRCFIMYCTVIYFPYIFTALIYIYMIISAVQIYVYIVNIYAFLLYMYICTVYVCGCVCIYIYIHMYMYIHACMHAYIHTSIIYIYI